MIEDGYDDGEGTLIEDGEPVSVEDRARAMGWKPRDEYRGDPRRWTDAEEFIAHGEAELPILRDQSRRMSEKLARMEGELSSLRNTSAEQAQAVRDAMKLAQRADERGYQRGLDELKAQQREAVALGDTQAFDQVEEQIRAAERERAVVESPEPVQQQQVQVPLPETVQFMAANPWMDTNLMLRGVIADFHAKIMRTSPNMPLAEQYALARAQLVAKFPEYFPGEQVEEGDDDEPRRRPVVRRAGTLEPSGVVPMRRAGASPFDRIENVNDRKEAKDAYDRMVRLGTTDMTAQDYVALYMGDQTDILAMRAARKKA